MIRLVTFDAAGTIIDHSWDPAGLAMEAAEAVGVSINKPDARERYEAILKRMAPDRADVELRGDPSEIRAHWRKGIAEWLDEMGQDPQRSREVHEYAERAVYKPGGKFWRLYPDVIPALDYLHDRKIAVGIISNWDRSLHAILENLGIRHRFSMVLASLELGIEKPHPAIFREAARRAGHPPEACAHIGDDHLDDVQGAEMAGWRAFHLVRPKDTLFDAVVEVVG